MSIIHEIHNQSPFVRRIMYWLAVTMTLGLIGFFWISSVEHDMFFALHTDPQERQDFLAQQESRVPQPLALMSKAFGSLTARIGGVFGFDSSKGFDSPAQDDRVYPLPISQ